MRRWIAATALLVGACGDDTEVAGGGANQDGEELRMRSVVTMLEPPDVDRYMDALRKREPGRMVEFDEEELFTLGEIACNLQVDAITPSGGPGLDVEMVDEMVKRGHPVDLSERIAPDIRNAVRGALCDVEYVAVEE